MTDAIGELKIKVKVEVDNAKADAEIKQSAAEAKTVWQEAAETIAKEQKRATQSAAVELTKRGQILEGATDAEIQARWKTVQASEQAAEAATEAQKKAAEETKKTWADAIGAVQTFALAAAAAVAATGVALTSMAADVGRQAQSLGLSVRHFQQLQFAAEAAGVETNDMLGAVGQLQQKAADAASGGSSGDLFTRLGISATDASGQVRDANELMLEAADAVGRLGPGTEQTAAAIQLFGDAGRKLVPTLAQGRAGMQGLFRQFNALGGGVSEDAARKALEMEHALTELKLAFVSAAQPILEAVLPALRQMVDFVRPLVADTHNMKVALAAVGVALYAAAGAAAVLNAALLPEIALVGLVAAAIAALVLMVDDLVVTLQGGDSVLKRVIDSMFGLGTTKVIVDALHEGVAMLVGAWDSVVEAVGYVGDAIGSMWDAVPEPLKRLLSGGAELALRSTPMGMVATAAQAAMGGDSFEQRRQGAAQEEMRAMLANVGVNYDALSRTPAAASATPAAATRAAATAATARGATGRTVNANQRVEVRVNGLVDPNQLANAVRPHIEEALRASNEDALAGLADTAEAP
jgi:hypothetical protein